MFGTVVAHVHTCAHSLGPLGITSIVYVYLIYDRPVSSIVMSSFLELGITISNGVGGGSFDLALKGCPSKGPAALCGMLV